MDTLELFERAGQAAAAIAAAVPEVPRIALVLGSGLGALADRMDHPEIIPYAQIPHFPRTSTPGHRGNLIIGMLGRSRVLVLQGRIHYYEGHSLDMVTFPIRVLQRLGIQTLVLTAAAGGILPSLRPGALVCLSDHLNLIGSNPLRGPNDGRLGVRFPDMTEVYSLRLRTLAKEEAQRLGTELVPGIYACLPGPTYETPAEVRMLRTLGADVVGMSTVPEAIVARHAGMDVLALALVTNTAAHDSAAPISHEEVIAAGRRAVPLLASLIENVIGRLVDDQRPQP